MPSGCWASTKVSTTRATSLRDRKMNGQPDPPSSPPASARALELALLITILVHVLAMLSMAALLLPGMPGGSHAEAADRAAYVAAHPWLWRLGWVPWQISALCDLLLALALLRTPWVPRLPAVLVLLTTVTTLVIEQPAELRWVTQGVVLAQVAVQQGDTMAYMRFEASVYRQVAAWAALLYTFTALGWTWCFTVAEVWNRFLTWLSLVTWSLFLVASVGPLLPEGYRLDTRLIAAG